MLFPEGVVEPSFEQQLFVCSFLEDLSVFEHVDFVRVCDRAEAVRDEDHHEFWACVSDFFDCCSDCLFGLRVEAACCFVEYQYVGFPEEGACDGEALFFSAAQPDSAFAYFCFQTGSAFCDVPDVCHAEHAFAFFVGRVWIDEEEVLLDRARE